MKCSIVIPVYNSSDTLELLVHRLERVLQDVVEDYEVVLVNDASHDASWQVITRLSEQHSRVFGINLMRNYGQHNALLAGIRAAQYEIIITLDDDLQHPPEEIPSLLTELQKGFDVVYGVPEKKKHSMFRSVTSSVSKWLMEAALGLPNISRSGAFRVFYTRLRKAFASYQSPFVSIDVLLTWGTLNFGYVVVRHESRHFGKSNYTIQKLVRHAFNMITGFSVLPLRLASLLGFVFTIFGCFVLIYVLGRYLVEDSPVQGFPFLASIITIFSGVQLFTLGIIGEYMARMYLRMMGQPSYTISIEKEK